MHKYLVLFTITFNVGVSFCQELNCKVQVISQLTGNENNVVFQTLERQLTEFVSNTTWTDKKFEDQERINCSMVITVNSYDNDNFNATLQVSSSRPIFNSTYSSPLYVYNDKTFNFQYLEFQNMVYNPIQFESNLISVLSFHVFMILGFDADSFALNGGDEYFKQAQVIANYSQQLNGQGWKLEDGLQSRFALIDNITSPTFSDLREANHMYHLKGLDLMSTNTKAAKSKIVEVVNLLEGVHNTRPNSFLMRVFFDAKADEIMDILSGGPAVNIANTKNVLNRVAPMHSQKWRNISF